GWPQHSRGQRRERLAVWLAGRGNTAGWKDHRRRGGLRRTHDLTTLPGKDDARGSSRADGGSLRDSTRPQSLRGIDEDRRAAGNARLSRRRRGTSTLKDQTPGRVAPRGLAVGW